jgi:hypothetical protein
MTVNNIGSGNFDLHSFYKLDTPPTEVGRNFNSVTTEGNSHTQASDFQTPGQFDAAPLSRLEQQKQDASKSLQEKTQQLYHLTAMDGFPANPEQIDMEETLIGDITSLTEQLAAIDQELGLV